MNSIWFNVADNEPSTTQNTELPFLGIFTDDPLQIAASLSRPLTPFENSDFISDCDTFFTAYEKDSKDLTENPDLKFAESPPRNVSLNVDTQTKRMFELSIYP